MTLPVHYKGRTSNGWYRYYSDRAFVNRRGEEYTVHIYKWRLSAWLNAWWTWLNLFVIGDEI